MARKEVTVVLVDGGQEKEFLVRAMPMSQLEDWILRASLLLATKDIDPASLPSVAGDSEGAPVLNFAAIAKVGMSLLGTLSYDKVKPLYAELLTCISVISNGDIIRLDARNVDVHIDDVMTMLKLRKEAVTVNVSFFDFGNLLKSMMTAVKGALPSSMQTSQESQES
jgi:hypothetical protein